VGARVRADVDSWRAGPEAVTDANGRFRLEGVRRPPPERADEADPWLVSVGVRAWLDGVGDARGRREFASDTAKGPEVDVGTLTLEAPAVLVGRVVDAAGRPVAGARVASERGMLGLRFDDGTESDAAGRFALALGAAWRADETLAASADGARRGLLAVRGRVAPGTAHEVRTIVVASAPTLRISVRDGATAVRGVVALMPADATLPFVHRDAALRAPTAADGTVELRHVVSGPARLVVWDAAGGTWSRPLDVRAAAGAPVEVAVRLPPSAPITGRVVDDAGVPVPWAELLVTTCAPESESTGPDAAVAAPDALPSARADAEGRFRLAPVPVGRAALVVRAAHHRTARPDVVVVPAREVEVRLARPRRR